MESKNRKEAKERMIHIRLPEAMHKTLRIRAAEADETIQEWVLQAIEYKLGVREKAEYEEKNDNDVQQPKGVRNGNNNA